MSLLKIKEELLLKCDKEETQRISEEIELFEKRNWNNYVYFLIGLLKELPICTYIGGSIANSYLIRKIFIEFEKDEEAFLNRTLVKEILFNDALRLRLDMPGPFTVIEKRINKILEYINNKISEIGFYKKEISEIHGYKRGYVKSITKLIVLSERELTEDEFTTIINEKRDSTEEENVLLRSILIIKINAKDCV